MSVLGFAGFWLMPNTNGCLLTMTRGLGFLPVSATSDWEDNVWACAFSIEFGAVRCRNLSRVDPKERKNTKTFTDAFFVVRPDQAPVWPKVFGPGADVFESNRETLVTNPKGEYLLTIDAFMQDSGMTFHKVCTGHWKVMTAEEINDLENKRRPNPVPSRSRP